MDSPNQLSPHQAAGLLCVGGLVFLGIWYGAAWLRLAPPQFLPMPHQVIAKMIDLTTHPFAGAMLQEHVASSILRFARGFALAVIIGIPLGLMTGWFDLLDDIFSPIFDALRFIAPIAWVPFAALWFGTGIGGPTLIIFAGAFPPCVINAHRGARQVDPILTDAARMLGAGSVRIIAHVLFPAAVPSIIAGLRVSAGLGWMSLVGAELIVASSGVGYMIAKGQGSINTTVVMAGMIAIGCVGVVIDLLVRGLEAWLLRNRRRPTVR